MKIIIVMYEQLNNKIYNLYYGAIYMQYYCIYVLLYQWYNLDYSIRVLYFTRICIEYKINHYSFSYIH